MLTYWFKGLPDPNESKAYQLEIFGYDPDILARIFSARIREDAITKRLLRRLAAEAVISVLFKS